MYRNFFDPFPRVMCWIFRMWDWVIVVAICWYHMNQCTAVSCSDQARFCRFPATLLASDTWIITCWLDYCIFSSESEESFVSAIATEQLLSVRTKHQDELRWAIGVVRTWLFTGWAELDLRGRVQLLVEAGAIVQPGEQEQLQQCAIEQVS